MTRILGYYMQKWFADIDNKILYAGLVYSHRFMLRLKNANAILIENLTKVTANSISYPKSKTW